MKCRCPTGGLCSRSIATTGPFRSDKDKLKGRFSVYGGSLFKAEEKLTGKRALARTLNVRQFPRLGMFFEKS